MDLSIFVVETADIGSGILKEADMKVNELQPGEYFIFNGHKYKRLKKIPSHDDNRHRPFKGDMEIEPLQQRLEVNYEWI